jgi:FkbM family methyltransferase
MVKDLVIDLGAHAGHDSAHYLSQGFRVVAVEANPELCRDLRDRFSKEIQEGKFRLLEAAIGEHTGESNFWVNERNAEWSSILQDVAERGGAARKISVPSVTFADLVRTFGLPYYVKIDIERADVFCLRALCETGIPRYLSVEAHELEYLFLLRSAGYNAFKCVDQMAHNDKSIPLFPRLRRNWGKLQRRIVKMPFPVGSSGPMSHETIGPWQTLDQAAYQWLHHRFGFQRRTHLYCRSWLDFHATVLPL